MGRLECELSGVDCANCAAKNEDKEQKHTLNLKKSAFILLLSGIIFTAGLLLNLSFRVELIMFGVSTLLAGGDITYKAP